MTTTSTRNIWTAETIQFNGQPYAQSYRLESRPFVLTIRRCAGSGWELQIDEGRHLFSSWPENHNGISGKGVDDCKAAARRFLAKN